MYAYNFTHKLFRTPWSWTRAIPLERVHLCRMTAYDWRKLAYRPSVPSAAGFWLEVSGLRISPFVRQSSSAFATCTFSVLGSTPGYSCSINVLMPCSEIPIATQPGRLNMTTDKLRVSYIYESPQYPYFCYFRNPQDNYCSVLLTRCIG